MSYVVLTWPWSVLFTLLPATAPRDPSSEITPATGICGPTGQHEALPGLPPDLNARKLPIKVRTCAYRDLGGEGAVMKGCTLQWAVLEYAQFMICKHE